MFSVSTKQLSVSRLLWFSCSYGFYHICLDFNQMVIYLQTDSSAGVCTFCIGSAQLFLSEFFMFTCTFLMKGYFPYQPDKCACVRFTMTWSYGQLISGWSSTSKWGSNWRRSMKPGSTSIRYTQSELFGYEKGKSILLRTPELSVNTPSLHSTEHTNKTVSGTMSWPWQ